MSSYVSHSLPPARSQAPSTWVLLLSLLDTMLPCVQIIQPNFLAIPRFVSLSQHAAAIPHGCCMAFWGDTTCCPCRCACWAQGWLGHRIRRKCLCAQVALVGYMCCWFFTLSPRSATASQLGTEGHWVLSLTFAWHRRPWCLKSTASH